MKKNKYEVDYEPKATMADYCKDCVHYLGVAVLNNCKKVNGHVRAYAWCKLFEE